MDTPTMNNTAETVRDLMKELGEHAEIITPEDHDLTKAHLVDLPETRRVKDLTDHHRAAAEFLKPARRRGTAILMDLDSLTDWSNRFKGDTTVLYADPDLKSPSITCIADYHDGGPVDVTNAAGDPSARHCHHRGVFKFPLSEEWKAWLAVTKGGMNDTPLPLDKDDLGEFLEAQAKDILELSPAILAGKISNDNQPYENRMIETAMKIEGRYGQPHEFMAMSREFQVNETSDLKVTKNRNTGESSIEFTNEHKDQFGKKLKLPNLMMIAIPVFLGAAPFRMAVRFRYRKSGGSVKFYVHVYNPEKIFETAIKEAVEQVKTNTELPVFYGRPEH